MNSPSSLKPHDVVILLKALSKGECDWKQSEIASELELSQGEIAKSLGRLRNSGLIANRRVNRSAVVEFLIHGLKYVFPAKVGALAVGLPTAMSSSFFKNKIVQDDDDIFVWPTSKGNVRGQSIKPLYPRLTSAVLKDESLYELLSLVEILRIGRIRERQIAEEELKKRIKSL